jgi:hypothetical protein
VLTLVDNVQRAAEAFEGFFITTAKE